MGRVAAPRAALLCVAAGLQTWAGAHGELVLLVTLTRHGSRVGSFDPVMFNPDQPGASVDFSSSCILPAAMYSGVSNILS